MSLIAGLDREKTHDCGRVHGGIKARENICDGIPPEAFFACEKVSAIISCAYLLGNHIQLREGACHHGKKLVAGCRCCRF